ncbi:MAG: iron-sulfur cluster assembly protein, partial [Candidatus Micrarchaeaceae archaeon]
SKINKSVFIKNINIYICKVYLIIEFLVSNMIKINDVIESLKKTVDPEIGLNIVDLGLIYGISISQQNDLDIKITMTSPMCPVTSIILADVQLRAESIEGVSKVNIDLVWDPAWSPEMITEEARLGLQ